jgi:hypothetical protein
MELFGSVDVVRRGVIQIFKLIIFKLYYYVTSGTI